MRELIIDGGTTNLRVYLLDHGTPIAATKADGGVRHTAIDGNTDRLRAMLKRCIDKVLSDTGTAPGDICRCTAFGMITSGLGLYELPHRIAPAGAEELRSGMKSKAFPDICPFEISFIPGVRNFSGTISRDNVSSMDMMRGEETESIGLCALLGIDSETVLVLPGSHNKFVHVSAEGKILGCMTSISGELIDALTHHSILSASTESLFCSEEEYSKEYACMGAEECLKSGIGRAAFAGRILNTLGSVPPASIRSYLLGAVLAEDIRAMQSFICGSSNVRFAVAGKAPLREAVCDVLALSGAEHITPVDPETSAKAGITGALLIAG